MGSSREEKGYLGVLCDCRIWGEGRGRVNFLPVGSQPSSSG